MYCPLWWKDNFEDQFSRILLLKCIHTLNGGKWKFLMHFFILYSLLFLSMSYIFLSIPLVLFLFFLSLFHFFDFFQFISLFSFPFLFFFRLQSFLRLMQRKQYVLRESIDIARPRFQETYGRADAYNESEFRKCNFLGRRQGATVSKRFTRRWTCERMNEPRFIERSIKCQSSLHYGLTRLTIIRGVLVICYSNLVVNETSFHIEK